MPAELTDLLSQAEGLRLSGELEAALEAFSQAQVAAQRSGKVAQQANALLGLGECLLALGRHAEGLDVVDDARSVADLAGKREISSRALGLRGRILALQGITGAAVAALREAVAVLAGSADTAALAAASTQLNQLLASLEPEVDAPAFGGPPGEPDSAASPPAVPVPGDFRVALLAAFAQELVGLPDVESLQERVIDLAMQIVQADHGLMLLLENGDLRALVTRTDDPAEDWTYSRTIAERVLQSGEPFFAIDALSDPRLAARQSVMALSLRTVVCVPLVAREDTLGVMYLDRRLINEVFTTEDLEVVTALAALTAQALVAARRIRDLEQLNQDLEHQLEALRASAG